MTLAWREVVHEAIDAVPQAFAGPLASLSQQVFELGEDHLDRVGRRDRLLVVHDQLATGSKLHILTVIDTFSRFSPVVVPRFSFRAPSVIDVLERVCWEVSYPASIRVDQGSEFVSAISTYGPICVA